MSEVSPKGGVVLSISFNIYLTNLEKYHFDTKSNDYFFFFVRGETRVRINHDESVFRSNDFFLVQVTDEIKILETKRTLVYVFEIREVSLVPYLTIIDTIQINSNQLSLYGKKKIQSTFSQLINQYFDPNSNPLIIQSFLLLFLDSLGKQSTYSYGGQEGLSSDAQRIKQIKQIIHQNIHTRLSIEDLAQQLFLTPQYLSKYIKDKLGTSYLKYVSQIRVKLAEKALIETTDSLTMIANQTGFANVNAMIHAFQETHQMTPKEYRLQHQETLKDQIETFSASTKTELEESIVQLKQNIIDEPSVVHQLVSKTVTMDATKGFNSELSNAKTINLGFARNLLSNAFQDQLSLVQSHLNFTYARFQGIFEHGLVDRIPNTEIYNFSKANRIIDFLYEHQLLPFMELGNKPEKINLSGEQYISLSENNSLYSNQREWQVLVKSFIKNCINRYGSSEVSKWLFDYWYPHGMSLIYKLSYADSYINNYQILYQTIKHYVPQAMVGGMGLNLTANEFDLANIVNYMSSKQVGFDFISFSAFHTESKLNTASLTSNPNYLTDKIKTFKQLVRIPQIPLILTEWSFDVSTRNYIHDSMFMASFIIKNLLENSHAFSDISYWLMSDLMIEFSDTNQLLFGGNGLISVDGLAKPSYFAYQFYRKLGKRVIHQGDGYIVTSNSIDSFQILLHNYQHPKETYCTQYRQDVHYTRMSEIFHEPKHVDITLILKNLFKSSYKIITYHLSEEHGSILNEWITLGSTKNLSNNEIAYLKNITQPSLHIEYTDEVDEIVINRALKPFEIVMIQISLEYHEVSTTE